MYMYVLLERREETAILDQDLGDAAIAMDKCTEVH